LSSVNAQLETATRSLRSGSNDASMSMTQTSFI